MSHHVRGKSRRASLRALAIGAATAITLAGAGAQAASAVPLLGIQGDGVNRATPAAAISKTVGEGKSVHAKVMRFEVSWAALEPTAQGVRDPAVVSSIDAFVDSAQRAGIRPLMFLDRTPCWASSAPANLKRGCAGSDANRFDVWRYAPSDPDSAVPVLTFLAQRYGDRLAALQLWNEPDQANEKYWKGPDKIARYVGLAKAAYPAIKAASPALPVLAGSFVGVDGRWLTALYKAGLKGSYDGLSVQFYDRPLAALKATRALQRRFGDTKPLWLTEFGYTSCAGKNGRPAFLADHPCVTRAVQARNLGDVFAATARSSWLGAVISYALRDEDRAYQFGVLDAKGVKKPSFAMVRRALGGKPGVIRKPTLRLRIRQGRAIVSGSGPGIDEYKLRVYVHGQLAYRARVAMTRSNRFSITLPRVIGTSGLSATLTAGWTGKAVRAKR